MQIEILKEKYPMYNIYIYLKAIESAIIPHSHNWIIALHCKKEPLTTQKVGQVNSFSYTKGDKYKEN